MKAMNCLKINMRLHKLMAIIGAIILVSFTVAQAEIKLVQPATENSCDNYYAEVQIPKGWYYDQNLSLEKCAQYFLPVHSADQSQYNTTEIVVLVTPKVLSSAKSPEELMSSIANISYPSEKAIKIPKVKNKSGTFEFIAYKFEFGEFYKFPYAIRAATVDKDREGREYFVEIIMVAKSKTYFEDAMAAYEYILYNYAHP